MNVLTKYEGKKVFLRTNKDRTYSGIVKEVVDIVYRGREGLRLKVTEKVNNYNMKGGKNVKS